MLSPSEIALNYANVAKSKVSQKWYKTLILAVLAGAFIAFGAAIATTASSTYEGAAAAVIKGAVFPVGLILVVICGAELFTGNCLLVSPAVGRDIKPTSLFKNWGIVYAGNLIGGVLIAVLVVFSHVQSDYAVLACINTAAVKCGMNFGDALLRGILCNMLVCLAVWAAMASKSVAGKILAVYLPILTFVACGFEHCVANMYYLTAGLMAGAVPDNAALAQLFGISLEKLNLGNAILFNLLPSTIGNIIGGCLIGLAYHFVYRFKVDEKK